MRIFVLFICLLLGAKLLVAQTPQNKAATLANEVMQAMGGQKNWQKTRHIHWNFFGVRTLTWDKQTNQVRIDFVKEPTTYLLNLTTGKGQAMQKGQVITNPDSLAPLLQKAREIWINDAYWLVMPFKLQDTGVQLTYLGEQPTADGKPADLLQLTFDKVGVTPQNKYHVWVDKSAKLVTQWAYFANATDEKPRFTLPWTSYERYGNILLSGSRGERTLTPIWVKQKINKKIYTDLSIKP